MTDANVSYATAPPSVGNMAVGFDVLGHALDAPGDQVRATRTSTPGLVTMGAVSGCVSELPSNPLKNTAGAGVVELLASQNADFGVCIDVHKGVALGSGMGGSASSAVASVVAANALLPKPLPHASLLSYALTGEQVASGCIHGDNVAPSLLGGIVFVSPRDPQHCYSVPVPDGLHCVLVRPKIRLDTALGRSLLSDTILLHDAVTQSAHFGRLLIACFNNDIEALGGALSDVLVEPQRSHQIDGFSEFKEKALEYGALGFSLSGSGPSMVAWVRAADLDAVRDTVCEAVSDIYDVDYQCVSSTVNAPGARMIDSGEWLGV
ncbi:MAG: homoserine kinase [Gammaproteobacteria bacterium]